jgi:hypothetical protein
MKLGEHFWSSEMDCNILRVPGGWVFRNYVPGTDQTTCSTFVPFSEEFKTNSEGSGTQPTIDNSGYITALSVFEQWKEEFDTCEGDKQGFYEWLKTRLHSLKAANDT